MRGGYQAIAEYVGRLAMLLERNGVTLGLSAGEDLELLEHTGTGSLSFELRGDLPGNLASDRSELTVRERFERLGADDYARVAYAYELVDRERDFRRAFHLHDPEWFQRELLVVVHEHCERPIGRVDCPHIEGSPIRDGYAGVTTLMDAWCTEPPDCSRLPCLE